MKVKDLKHLLDECEDNLNVYVQYEGCETEIEEGDTFKTKNVEYDGSIVMIIF